MFITQELLLIYEIEFYDAANNLYLYQHKKQYIGYLFIFKIYLFIIIIFFT